jgi:hypothetical protein
MPAPFGALWRLAKPSSRSGAGVGRDRTELGWLLCRQGQGPSSGRHQGIGLETRGAVRFASTVGAQRNDGALPFSARSGGNVAIRNRPVPVA